MSKIVYKRVIEKILGEGKWSIPIFTRRFINNKASPRVAGGYNIFKNGKGFYVLEWQ